MHYLLLYLLTGWAILIMAILLNGLANKLRLQSWYGYIQCIVDRGWLEATRETGVISVIFMYFIYPLLLGATGWISISWIKASILGN